MVIKWSTEDLYFSMYVQCLTWKDISKCACMHPKSLQSCLTLCDPVDCSPLGSSVHGILQARTLEWVATTSSSGSFQPRDRTRVSYEY